MNSAASSSALPPISPIMTMPCVSRVGQEHLQALDEVGAVHRIAADADAGASGRGPTAVVCATAS